MRRPRPPAITLALTLVALVAAPAAEAKRGPCIPGQKKPKCRVWTGKVMAVADGDTINARIRTGGGLSRRTDIRLLGIQAMELTDYSRSRGRRGACHAVEAAERLEFLLQGRRVKRRTIRIASRRAGSVTQGARARLRRAVAFRSGGRWHDAGAVLMGEGHGLWDPNGKEWAWNKRYAKLAQRAARDARELWDPDACRPGPSQASILELKVKWDAPGQDGKNVNGEWVRIRNTDPVNDVPLRGWWLRDAFLRRYTFPRGAVVPAGGSIRLRMGRGRSGGDTYYWGQRDAVFENVKGGRRAIGDGAYLFDPDGDLRAWVMYPCRVACSEPLRGRVRIQARRRAPESIRVTNTSDAPIDLFEYEVESVPWFYEFGTSALLPPGESIVLNVRGNPGRDTRFEKNWGFDRYLLGDKKDVVTLRNPLGAPVTCHAWGRGTRCPGV